MGSFSTLLFVYVLGGVTFIPLVVVAVLAHAYYTFPYREDVEPAARNAAADEDAIVQPGDDTTALDAAKEARPRPAHGELDVATGYFAVHREYTPMGINAKPIERSTPGGSGSVALPSPSVYQTMYRSIFDRKPVSDPLDSNSLSQRPKKVGNVFYVVLRHGHLMLFDDDEQLEVRHVISLAHHDISIYSGGDLTPEGELFIKRNALCLSRKGRATEDNPVSRPFYLFSENCSAKEDFYFALLKNQHQTFGAEDAAPKAQQFDVKNIISLVQKLHSTDEHLHSRWLNAMLGRIFLGVYRTRDLESFIREKITKKISRVKRPSFLTNITLRDINTGEAAPFFTNLKLKDLTVEGESVVEADVKYTGNFRIEVAATATIDLGQRFKTREVNLVLAVVLKRLEGHVLFKIKPPPSNRVWFSFQTMPKMEMAIEPIVSSRQITYTVILRQIEHRIKEILAETLVQPYWDDVPFFRTEHKRWRGGIWDGDDAIAPHGGETAAAEAGDVDTVGRMEDTAGPSGETRPMEKSYTMPVLEAQPVATGLFGRKLNRGGVHAMASASSTSVDAKGANANPPQSPKFSKGALEPGGTDAAHAEIPRPMSSPPDYDPSLLSTPPGSPAKAHPLAHKSSQSSASSRGGDEDELDDVESTPVAPGRRDTASSAESGHSADATDGQTSDSPTTSSFKSHTGSVGRGFFSRHQPSSSSLATTATGGSDAGQKRSAALGAVANAATQARNWGWNAIQRQREAKKNGDPTPHVDLSQPMGRGQPLPPPGTPLPRPANGKTKIAPPPVPKRKPVPPPRPTEDEEAPEAQGEARHMPPPPLPHRRRRLGSTEQEGDDRQNILVVPMPDDSEPDTPGREDMPDYPEPMDEMPLGEEPVRREPAEDRKMEYRAGSRSASDGTPEEAASMTPEEHTGSGSPIIAMPASDAAAADDDDDYSGWMENEETTAGAEEHEPHTTAVTTEEHKELE